MSPERWGAIKGQIKDNEALEVIEEGEGEFEDMPGEIQFIIFNGPMGKTKLEFVIRPVILDKKTSTSRRIGSDVAVDYVYSEDEFTHKLTAYQWNEGQEDWEEMKASMFDDDDTDQ